MKVYIDTNDWWIGYYRGDSHHYVCPLPTVVFRFERRAMRAPSERIRCVCAKRSPDYYGFRVCALCGNKRCPHAANHRNTCTRSNEPGQKGSLYPELFPTPTNLQEES